MYFFIAVKIMTTKVTSGITYLDNNATTKTCDEAKQVMADWIQSCSNASGSSFLSQASQLLINKAISYVNTLCKLKNEYMVIFTSGASESNCSIIHMTVDAWHHNVGTVPHIVTTSIEHKSILECLDTLVEQNRIEVTLIDPNMYGVTDPEAIEKALRGNTALVTVMFANNEIGSINPVKKIAEIVHKRNIPFHTDAVQIFGKLKLDIPGMNIDALSMSFHKLYGPPGVGMLIIRKSFVEGYKLRAQIAGTQQNGLRGGTENVPAIAGAIAAMKWNFNNRNSKNKRLRTLRDLTIKLLEKNLNRVDYNKFYDMDKDDDDTDDSDEILVKKDIDNIRSQSKGKDGKKTTSKSGKEFVVLGPPQNKVDSYLPSTLLISIIDNEKPFCNVKFKNELEKNKIIVSIGSACNTKSTKASHVLEAIRAPAIVKRGVLRISFSDYNTTDDIKKFINVFFATLKTI